MEIIYENFIPNTWDLMEFFSKLLLCLIGSTATININFKYFKFKIRNKEK